MAKYLFGDFAKCLYPVQKFHSEAERKLAVILERDSIKWFKPAKGQFQLFYKWNSDHHEYQPDFVAETESMVCLLEPKARNEIESSEVLAKKQVAERWCLHASDHARSYDGKPWKYALIPHDVIQGNMTLEVLVRENAGS